MANVIVERQAEPSRLPGWLAPLLLALAALCAVLPLVLHGCSCGHDFDFHLLSWMEASAQWQHGVLKPVWAFTPAYNAGEPRLLMYPPLSWMTGAAVGTAVPWAAAPAVFTWLVLFLCGLSMHWLLRRWTSPAIAFFGGCLYMVNPYMLFVAYERTAYAELMAAAWMPLLLAAMLRERVSVWRVAVPIALLWLTNAPAALVGSYALLLLGLLRLLFTPGLRNKLLFSGRVTAGVAIGLLADAFYLVPMGYERRFVQLALAVVPIARPDANFLFTVDKDAFHTHVLVQASWIAIGLCAAGAVCGALVLLRHAPTTFRSMRSRELHTAETMTRRHVVSILFAFTVIIFFFQTRLSVWLWHVLPELVYMQFPWRFLAAEAAVAVALVSLMIGHFSRGASWRLLLPGGVLLALLVGYAAGDLYFREGCADYESVQAQRQNFLHGDGVEATDEYTPKDADNGDLPLHLPPAWIAREKDQDLGKSPVLPAVDRSRPEDIRVTTAAAGEARVLILRLRHFAGWHILRDGQELQPDVRKDGLITVPLPAGMEHHVEAKYEMTADQWAGIGVTALTLLGCGVAIQRRRSSIMGPTA